MSRGLSNKGRQLLQLNIHVSRSPSHKSLEVQDNSNSKLLSKPKLNQNPSAFLSTIKVEQPEKRPKDLSNIPLNLSGINNRPNVPEVAEEGLIKADSKPKSSIRNGYIEDTERKNNLIVQEVLEREDLNPNKKFEQSRSSQIDLTKQQAIQSSDDDYLGGEGADISKEGSPGLLNFESKQVDDQDDYLGTPGAQTSQTDSEDDEVFDDEELAKKKK